VDRPAGSLHGCLRHTLEESGLAEHSSWCFISAGDQIITPASELMMAHRVHSHITMFQGGSHLTLISHPNAASAVIASAICSVH
jgi:hypothetical protein